MSSTPEKSTFSQRCNLLSRYLKEKGSFGNIDIGLPPISDSHLPRKFELRGKQNLIKKAKPSETKPSELFNKLSVVEPSTSSGGKAKDVDLREAKSIVPEPINSQLTIFFEGKVIVYNEFPEDKAKKIMEAAKEATPVPTDSRNTLDLDMNIRSKSNTTIPDLNEPTGAENNDDHQTRQENQVVERIARRASLHRFFAKRKDRAVARAPYQVNQNSGHLPPKPKMVQPAKLGQSSQQPAHPPKPKSHNDDMLMEVDEEAQCSKDLELKL